MNYPERLLPQTNYKMLSTCEVLSEFHLVRHTANDDIYLAENTDEINPDKCFPDNFPSVGMEDLSTSLLGTFILDDIYIKPTDEFTEYWHEGASVKIPIHQQDFELDTSRHYFHFQISTIDGYEISTENKEKVTFKTTFKILHTPTVSNFWHFSVRVYVDTENLCKIDKSHPASKIRKHIYRTAKTSIREFLKGKKRSIPVYTPVEANLYMN